MNASPATPADAELFEDSIACALDLPAEFRPGPATIALSSAETVLRGIGMVEDQRREDAEDRGELPPAIHRLEAKLDLLLMLMGQFARQGGQLPPLRPVRWSRRGIRLETGARSAAGVGTAGVVRLQPASWLPECVELPVMVMAEAASGAGGYFLWLRFAELGASLEAALERHLFRLHRRQVAESRQAR